MSILEEINIYYYPDKDVNHSLANEDGTFDIIVSSNVLELIKHEMLAKNYRSMDNVSNDNGIMVHRFNPSGHFVKLSGSTITFLTVSDFVWDSFLGV